MSYKEYSLPTISKEHMDYINSIKNANCCYAMFSYHFGLTTLDLSNFSTKYVTDISYMFAQFYKDISPCYNLKDLNVSTWNTKNLRFMRSTFAGCRSLVELDLSSWDTKNVLTMSYLFSGCTSLTKVQGVLDLSSCLEVDEMFSSCENLKKVHLKNVPNFLINPDDGSLKNASGKLNETYIIENVISVPYVTYKAIGELPLPRKISSIISMTNKEWNIKLEGPTFQLVSGIEIFMDFEYRTDYLPKQLIVLPPTATILKEYEPSYSNNNKLVTYSVLYILEDISQFPKEEIELFIEY